jgi:hypothetical protein
VVSIWQLPRLTGELVLTLAELLLPTIKIDAGRNCRTVREIKTGWATRTLACGDVGRSHWLCARPAISCRGFRRRGASSHPKAAATATVFDGKGRYT